MENYMGLSGHPDVKRYLEHKGSSPKTPIQQFLDGNMLKKLAAESGADDSGLISIDDPLLADQRQDILSAFPKCKSLLSIVCRLNRNNVRCIDRAVSDTEYIQTFHRVNEVCRRVASTLEKDGINALYPASGFPMDMSMFLVLLFLTVMCPLLTSLWIITPASTVNSVQRYAL
jgi:hypothetical protein